MNWPRGGERVAVVVRGVDGERKCDLSFVGDCDRDWAWEESLEGCTVGVVGDLGGVLKLGEGCCSISSSETGTFGNFLVSIINDLSV